jgi:hypothetical protein
VQGVPGDSALAYAHINADGTFDAARSKGVLDSELLLPNLYCIDFAGLEDTPPSPAIRAKIVQATLTTQGGEDPGEITAGVNGCSGVDVTGDVYVRVTNSAGDPAAQEFDVLIVTP